MDARDTNNKWFPSYSSIEKTPYSYTNYELCRCGSNHQILQNAGGKCFKCYKIKCEHGLLDILCKLCQ